MKCRMAGCFIAAIVESCLSHFAKCRCYPFSSKQELLLFQLEITEELAHVLLPLALHSTTYACITSTFDCNYAFCFSLPYFLSPKGFPLKTEGKQGSQQGL